MPEDKSSQLIFLTEGQASEIIPRSKFWFQKRRWAGDGPPYVKVGGRVLYERQALIDWLRQHSRTSTTDSTGQVS